MVVGPLSLRGMEAVRVRQVKEWGEILTGFETRNRYEVLDGQDRPLLFAGEVGGGLGVTLLRLFLKAKRPFVMELRSPDNRVALSLKRPWRWFFSRLEVQDSSGRHLGSIQQRFRLLSRRYDIEGPNGELWVTLEGPLFKPWTFFVKRGQETVGKIVKRWTGLGKEMFTDADNFGVEFTPALRDDAARILVLAATFLIDFVHFENRD